jgi:hypothetical protein
MARNDETGTPTQRRPSRYTTAIEPVPTGRSSARAQSVASLRVAIQGDTSVPVLAAGDLATAEADDGEDRADDDSDDAENPDDVDGGDESDDQQDYSENDQGISSLDDG